MARAFPWIVLTVGLLMTSGAFAMIKYLMDYVTAAELLVIRFLPASFASIIIIMIFYRKTAGEFLSKYWLFFLGREAIAIVGYHWTLNYAETVLPAGVSALVVGTWPVLTYFIAAIFVSEVLTLRKLAGGILAFAGAAVVITFGAQHEAEKLMIDPAQWFHYSAVLLFAPVSAALATVATRWFQLRENGPRMRDSFLYSLIARTPSGFLSICVYLLIQRTPSPVIQNIHEIPPLFWVLAATLAFYNSIFGFWLWNWSIQRIQVGSVASFTYLQTAFALVIAWVFMGEHIDLLKILGTAAIIAGVLVSNIDRKSLARVKITGPPIPP